jgi:ElaB/YqjD/DUF883 family membrane-anchored ribosome-binding protein
MTAKDIDTEVHAADADATRARIASTLDDLSERLNPRTVVSNAMNDIQDRGGELFEDASRIVRQNPVAISLIGLSLGLLMLGRNLKNRDYDAYEDVYGDGDIDAPRGEGRLHRGWSTVRDRAGELRSGASERAAHAREAAAERLAHARETASETWASARETGADYAARAKVRAAEARARAGETFEENPLSGALLGLAVGIVAGALLPRSRQEDELLGETRDRLAARAKDAAKAATDAGKAQLDELGLNLDNAKAKLGDIGEQAKTVARNAATAATEQLKARSAA